MIKCSTIRNVEDGTTSEPERRIDYVYVGKRT